MRLLSDKAAGAPHRDHPHPHLGDRAAGGDAAAGTRCSAPCHRSGLVTGIACTRPVCADNLLLSSCALRPRMLPSSRLVHASPCVLPDAPWARGLPPTGSASCAALELAASLRAAQDEVGRLRGELLHANAEAAAAAREREALAGALEEARRRWGWRGGRWVVSHHLVKRKSKRAKIMAWKREEGGGYGWRQRAR